MKSTITSKSQTTVPREIRAKLGVGPGDVLSWEWIDGAVRVAESRVRFAINKSAAEKAGLKVSSKLLRLADLVE